MRVFVSLFIVDVVAVFRFLLTGNLLRLSPTCVLIVFFTVFFDACFGVFFLVDISINSFPLRFAAGTINFRVNGSAIYLIPIARYSCLVSITLLM